MTDDCWMTVGEETPEGRDSASLQSSSCFRQPHKISLALTLVDKTSRQKSDGSCSSSTYGLWWTIHSITIIGREWMLLWSLISNDNFWSLNLYLPATSIFHRSFALAFQRRTVSPELALSTVHVAQWLVSEWFAYCIRCPCGALSISFRFPSLSLLSVHGCLQIQLDLDIAIFNCSNTFHDPMSNHSRLRAIVRFRNHTLFVLSCPSYRYKDLAFAFQKTFESPSLYWGLTVESSFCGAIASTCWHHVVLSNNKSIIPCMLSLWLQFR